MLTQAASVSDLEQQIAQLRHALDAQRETVAAHAFAHATLAAVSSQICVLDASGVILAVNQAWRDFYALNLPEGGSPVDWIGTNYLAICEAAAGEHSAGATEVADGIRRVIRGDCNEFSLDYACHGQSVQRWFTVRVTRFHDSSGNVVVAHENITARKQAELREAVHSQTMTLMARDASLDEILDALVRGVYARHDLRKGHALCDADIYLAIPLQKGQISCRELMRGELLLCDVAADGPIMIDMIDSPYAENEQLKALIYQRGL